MCAAATPAFTKRSVVRWTLNRLPYPPSMSTTTGGISRCFGATPFSGSPSAIVSWNLRRAVTVRRAPSAISGPVYKSMSVVPRWPMAKLYPLK